jgi:hypothetical protein
MWREARRLRRYRGMMKKLTPKAYLLSRGWSGWESKELEEE